MVVHGVVNITTGVLDELGEKTELLI